MAIAPIEKLGIITSSRTVYVDDAPEVLMVTGYDTEGNTFSTYVSRQAAEAWPPSAAVVLVCLSPAHNGLTPLPPPPPPTASTA